MGTHLSILLPKHITACNLFIGWRRLNAPLGEVIKYFTWLALPLYYWRWYISYKYKVYARFSYPLCVAMQLKPYKFVKDLDGIWWIYHKHIKKTNFELFIFHFLWAFKLMRFIKYIKLHSIRILCHCSNMTKRINKKIDVLYSW